MIATAAAHSTSGSALWFLSRATGVVSLALLTLVMVLGILTRGGRPLPGAPRFVTAGLHRNAALLAVVLLVLHVATAVADPYAPIRLVDSLVPFVSAYRPLWLGFGALALDLLIAVVVTSLLRLRVGRRTFRVVHWAAYAVWPVALVHGLGTGSDVRTRWMLLLTVACVGGVLLAAGWRVLRLSPVTPGRRVVTSMAAVAAPAALAGWMLAGPLAPHWAARAGTPVALIRTQSVATGGAATTTAVRRLPSGPVDVTGSITQHVTAATATIVLTGHAADANVETVKVVLHGTPAAGGGVALSAGSVRVSSAGTSYRGPVTSLDGGNLVADVRGPQASLQLTAQLVVDSGAGRFTGTVTLR